MRLRVRDVLADAAFLAMDLERTGKSTIAAQLGAEAGAVVVRSDEVRKELVGLPSGAHAPAAPGEGIYDAATTDETYRALRAQDFDPWPEATPLPTIVPVAMSLEAARRALRRSG